MRLPWLVCTVCRSFLTIFWFPFPLWLTLPRDWALLDSGLCFSSAHHFSCYHLLPYHSIIPTAKLFASILLGLFGPAVYSSPNGPVRPLILLLHHWRAPVSHLFSLGCLSPVCFPWASSAFFLTWHSHGILLNFFGLPWPNYIIPHPWGSLACHKPLLSLVSLLRACHGPFSLFHIIYCPWFAFYLFPGSFKPIYLLKAHLFISWACDPLSLPLGLNGFSIYLPTIFCPCYWASPFHLGFQNGHQQVLFFNSVLIFFFYFFKVCHKKF